MSQFDKVEVMDFLINVLKDHEKSLDELIARAEVIVNERTEDHDFNNSASFPMKIVLKDWQEFKVKALSIDLICFNLLNNVFVISASHGQRLYEYREIIPQIDLTPNSLNSGRQKPLKNHRLSIGLELTTRMNPGSGEIKPEINYEIDLQYTRAWLSKELHVNQSLIVCGDIEI